MLARHWLIGLALMLITGCATHSKAKPTETSVNIISEVQSEQDREMVPIPMSTNTNYTIKDLHQNKIQDPITLRIIEDAITRLKKQKIFYDTVEYIFEIEAQEDDEQLLIRVKEQYSDSVIERLHYTIDLTTFTD